MRLFSSQNYCLVLTFKDVRVCRKNDLSEIKISALTCDFICMSLFTFFTHVEASPNVGKVP